MNWSSMSYRIWMDGPLAVKGGHATWCRIRYELSQNEKLTQYVPKSVQSEQTKKEKIATPDSKFAASEQTGTAPN